METLKLTYQEYWGYYWRVVSRHKIPGIFKWDEDLVDLIEKQCQLPKGASILDLGCGGGDQAKLFSRRGYRVVGIDKVKSLIDFAKEAFRKEKLTGEFHQADMREIEYQNEFGLCVMLSGTFGLLAEKENERLLKLIHRALKPDGQAFISYSSLERFSKLSYTRSWNTIEQGFALREEWFNVSTSTYHSRNTHILLEGKIIQAAEETDYGADEIIRCYGAREMELLAEKTGFSVKAHLSNKNIGNPDYAPEAGEPRGNIILTKMGSSLVDI
jgi:ubiquinone/menaquinone biosynthesis C-methylase UbiE